MSSWQRSGPAGWPPWANGRPHVSPLWFVWDGGSLWLLVVRSQRWTDIERDPRVAVVVDAGWSSASSGASSFGTVDAGGPRPAHGRRIRSTPELAAARAALRPQVTGRDEFTPDGRHAWLRLTPDKIVSWDFRKMDAGLSLAPTR